MRVIRSTAALAALWTLHSAAASAVVLDFDTNFPDGSPIPTPSLVSTEFQTEGVRFRTVSLSPGGLPVATVGSTLSFTELAPGIRVASTSAAASPPNHTGSFTTPAQDDILVEFVDPCRPRLDSTTNTFALSLDLETTGPDPDPVILYALDANDQVLDVDVATDDQSIVLSVAAPTIAKVLLDFDPIGMDAEGYDNYTYTLPACNPVVVPAMEHDGLWILALGLMAAAAILAPRLRSGL